MFYQTQTDGSVEAEGNYPHKGFFVLPPAPSARQL
jgi:hypothetical protein